MTAFRVNLVQSPTSVRINNFSPNSSSVVIDNGGLAPPDRLERDELMVMPEKGSPKWALIRTTQPGVRPAFTSGTLVMPVSLQFEPSSCEIVNPVGSLRPTRFSNASFPSSQTGFSPVREGCKP